MMTDIYSFGEWLKRCRKLLDLTQKQMGQRIGYAEETVRKIEADARRPSRQVAERLAETLKLPEAERTAFVRAAIGKGCVDQLPPWPPVAPPDFTPPPEGFCRTSQKDKINAPVPLLVIRPQDSSATQREWSKDEPVLTLGRDSANDIIIGHPLASRRHARLEHNENGYLIRDLESTNGTYVNGDRIEGAHVLRNQDTVWVADTTIVFNDPEGTEKGPHPMEILKRAGGR
jgi:transcriptional regulator with XRE-family HTH domain